MGAHAHHSREPGWTSGLTFAQLSKLDPSKMLPISREFMADAQRRFKWLMTVIWKAVVDLDVLDVGGAAERSQVVTMMALRTAALMDPEDVIAQLKPKQYAFPRSAAKVEGFMGWLDEMEQKSVLEISRRPGAVRGMEQAWSDVYVHSAYQKGVARGREELRAAGYNVPSFSPDAGQDVSIAFNQPIHADRLGLAYTRSFTDLKGITKAMDTQISRVLSEGLAAGRGPMQIARDINDRVSKIGLTRAKTLARTEVMRAHHSANMGEYRNAQAMGIKMVAEWETGATPCDICSSLAQKRVWQIDEIEGMIPVHPNCQCVAVPLPADFAGKEVKDAVEGASGYLPDCSSIMHDIIPPYLLQANTLMELLEQRACLTEPDRKRVGKALAAYHPSTKALQDLARANEMRLVKGLRRAKVDAVWKSDNEPYDVWVLGGRRGGVPAHLIEVKTKKEAVGATADQITMRKECRLRKIEEWEKYKAQGTMNHTVLFDERGVATKIYYREGVGNFWIDDMQEVSWKELDTLFKTGVGPDTVKGVQGYMSKCVLRGLSAAELDDLYGLTVLSFDSCITAEEIRKVERALDKYPPKLPNISYMKVLMEEGASDRTILELFTKRYASEGVTDPAFVARRIKAYKKAVVERGLLSKGKLVVEPPPVTKVITTPRIVEPAPVLRVEPVPVSVPIEKAGDLERIEKIMEGYSSKISNIEYMGILLKEGASDETIWKLFSRRYASGGVSDPAYVAKRIRSYKKAAIERAGIQKLPTPVPEGVLKPTVPAPAPPLPVTDVALTDAQRGTLDFAAEAGAVKPSQIDELAKKWAISDGEVKAVADKLADSIEVRINIDFEDGTNAAYKNILEDGWLKNQFTLKAEGKKVTTGGSMSPYKDGSRDRWEKVVSKGRLQNQVHYRDAKSGSALPIDLARERPIYGYVKDFKEYNEAYQYGDVAFVLKKGVNKRAGFTLNNSSLFNEDTLSRNYIEKNLGDCSKNIGNLLERYANRNTWISGRTEVSKIISGEVKVGGFNEYGYVESQVYGGINIGRDVEKIVVHGLKGYYNHVEALGRKWGLRVEYAKHVGPAPKPSDLLPLSKNAGKKKKVIKFKIVSVTDCNDELISGYLDDGRSYKRFGLRPDGTVRYGVPMPKKGFKNLEHFAGVIGKFDPYAFVILKPIVVKRLDFQELSEIIKNDPRMECT